MCPALGTHLATATTLAESEFAGYAKFLAANMVFTFDFNQKFASSLVPSSVKDCVMDFVISFLKMWSWWQAFQNNTKKIKYNNISFVAETEPLTE